MEQTTNSKHEITPRIIELIRQAIADTRGSQAAFSRYSGISTYNLSKILSGNKKYVFGDIWSQLCDVFPEIDDRPANHASPISNVEPVSETIKSFPVISEAAAAQCNTAFIPIVDWADEYAEDRVSFSEGRAGDFVVRVTGESMLPWYPPNTLILARPNERMQNGDRVIAVLGDGSVVFKVFAEKDEYFYLLSVNDTDGRDFKFRKNDFSAVRAIYLVVQSMRDERALDRAMSQKGISHFWQDKIKDL